MMEIGWWILPLLVTLASALWVRRCSAQERANGNNRDYGIPSEVFTVPIALVMSLFAWLVWALLRLWFNVS